MKDQASELLYLGTHIGRTFARQVLGIVLGICLAAILARTLGPAGNGIYALAILLPLMGSAILNLGVAPANAHFLGRGSVSVSQAFRTSLAAGAVLSAVGLVVALPIVWIWNDRIFPGVPRPLLLVAWAVFPIMLIQSFLASILQGMQDFKKYNLALLAAPAVTLLFALLLIVEWGMGVIGGLLAYALGQTAALLVSLGGLRGRTPKAEKPGDDKGYARRCVSYGWKAHVGNVLTLANYRVGLFLVNLMLSPAAAGVYAVATQLAEQLWILSHAAGIVLLPRLSEKERKGGTARLTLTVGAWVFGLTLVAAVGLALVAPPLIQKLFGGAYVDAYRPLLWLLPGIVLGSFSRILANAIAARGRPELNMITAVMVAVINVVGGVLLIPRMGIGGAALAASIAFAFNAVAKIILFWWTSRTSMHRE